jgi:Fe-S-cluster containining protein
MSNFFECQSCGEHLQHESMEKHVKEMHFWN